jgi:hypothetical protein
MRRRPLGGAVHPQLLLLPVACLLGVGACWQGDLPALATRSMPGSDAGTIRDAGPSGIDAADNVIVVAQPSPGDGGQGTGEIALSVSMPVDTAATGQVVAIDAVTIALIVSDPAAARSVTLQLGQPRQQVRINLIDIPAGGPYTLETSASAGGVACATSTLPFSVLEAGTVRVFLALVCSEDAGWSATL